MSEFFLKGERLHIEGEIKTHFPERRAVSAIITKNTTEPDGPWMIEHNTTQRTSIFKPGN